jgi:hypothetical protein
MSEVFSMGGTPVKREARDSALDSVVSELPWHDEGALDKDKGPLVTRGALKLLAGAVVLVVVSVALAFWLA